MEFYSTRCGKALENGYCYFPLSPHTTTITTIITVTTTITVTTGTFFLNGARRGGRPERGEHEKEEGYMITTKTLMNNSHKRKSVKEANTH